MRLGCLGCLTVLVFLALIGGVAWFGIQIFREPEGTTVSSTKEDGVRAQQKIFALTRRSERGGSGAESVILSERELDAFLARHLGEIEALPLSDIGLRLPGDGIAEVRARIALRHLVAEPPLSAVTGALPASWLEQRVWVRVRTRPRIEPGAGRRVHRYLRLEIVEFAVGRQRLPAVLPRLLLEPGALRVLRWPVPDGIEGIMIEGGRVLVRVAS